MDLDKFKEMDIERKVIQYLKDLINIVESKILLNEKDLKDSVMYKTYKIKPLSFFNK